MIEILTVLFCLSPLITYGICRIIWRFEDGEWL